MSRIEALILDYGGVVIHEDPADYDDIGRPLGFSDGQLWKLVHSIPQYLPSRVGKLSSEQFQQALHDYLCRTSDAEIVDVAIEKLLEYYRARESIRPVMQTLLASLKGTMKLALLSNATRGSTQRFEQRGLLEYFDVIICSGDIGMAKPDPDACRFVAQRLAVPIERCGFVDDVQENVNAALELGMKAMHYHHSRHAEFLMTLKHWQA